MDRFAALTGRQYHLFDYVGAPDAERVDRDHGLGRRDGRRRRSTYLTAQRREGRRAEGAARTGRSRSQRFLAALPPTVARDRRARPDQGAGRARRAALPGRGHGARRGAERAARAVRALPRVIGGRYGLSSKEFTPAMVKAVFDELARTQPEEPLHRRHRRRRDAHQPAVRSRAFDIEPDDVVRAVFYGLGADGTVGANKNSIKIIGEETDHYAQGYFVYDSKKSGVDHGLAPALRPAADPLAVPDPTGQLRRLPPVRLPRALSTCSSCAAPGAIVPAEQPVRPGRGLGPAAARGAGADHRRSSCAST